jgi:hypothetical protein
VNPVGVAPARLEQAVDALGWREPNPELPHPLGELRLLDGLRLLDARVVVAASGTEPRGILLPVGASWRQTLSIARTCLPLAPTALLFSAAEPPSELCLLECGYAEVGVVVDATVLLAARRPRPAGSRRRSMDRELAQQLTSQLTSFPPVSVIS